jgi:hypothetical protein
MTLIPDLGTAYAAIEINKNTREEVLSLKLRQLLFVREQPPEYEPTCW